MPEDTNHELERFRNQWREEVTARSKGATFNHQRGLARHPVPIKTERSLSKSNVPPRAKSTIIEDEEEPLEESVDRGYHDLEAKEEARSLRTDTEGIHSSKPQFQKPRSALDHYEKAVEKEIQGSLGDSLDHYRKAFRLDEGVDKIYKNKYFPLRPASSKPTDLNHSNAAVTVPNPAHHSLDGPPKSIGTFSQLIASFASLPITGVPPPTSHSPLPPCPISSIPSEILIEILHHLAISDIACFARLSQVCKRTAYLVATEDHIWRCICLGPELGFPAMHYTYACSIEGTPLPPTTPEISDSLSSIVLNSPQSPFSTDTTPLTLFPLNPTYPTYAHMFHHRPRLRFAGIYISTVNYVRPGASSPNQVSWNTPVHIVTYYRYLRFFRDGSAISLLTTSEPIDVVHHLTKEQLAIHRQGHVHGQGQSQAGSGLPGAVMRNALRGRWRMSPPHQTSASGTLNENDLMEPEGNVEIETEGVDAKYFYSMQLALRSSSRNPQATKNNKLVWRGFWSYNRLTDDWAEFRLTNDRAFFWSRVRSFGVGV